MSKHLAHLVIAVLLLPCMCFAGASGQAVERAVVAQTLDAFEKEASTVRDGMRPGGVYEYITEGDKARVEAGLERMHKLLQEQAGQGQLSKDDQVALLNTQESVNAILLQNGNNRLIC